MACKKIVWGLPGLVEFEAKGKKKVRFPSAEKLAVELKYVRKPYFKWIKRLKISVYLEDDYPRKARM